jgi:hypothetical protein
MYIYTVSKGKLMKEDIYTRLDESKLFIGLLVNLIWFLPYSLSSLKALYNECKNISNTKRSQIDQTW